jgi:hypothetical protein
MRSSEEVITPLVAPAKLGRNTIKNILLTFLKKYNNMTVDQFISLITAPDLFRGPLLILKIVVIAFSLGVLVFIIVLIMRTSWLRFRFLENFSEFFTYKPYGVRKLLKQWTKTRARLDSGLESEYKLAIIEADSMLDGILKKMGYGGETLGERLKIITSAIIPNLDEVKEAHQIRNNIVHDSDFKLSQEEARKAMTFYEKALTELGAL